MANPYAYNVLTFAGAALIAQATAANPIVIVGAVSRATAASSDEDLAAKDASWYTGKTGIIEAVSASANVAKIVARFNPEDARQDAKSIAVTARLASQTDADAIVLTAKSDPDATAILPGSGDTLAYVRFPFNIFINTSGSVQVTPGASASMADLARFVSLHKAGDPTQGDSQTILGEKTFMNSANFAGVVTVQGALYAEGAVGITGNVQCEADLHVDGDVGCDHLSSSGDITTAQSYICSGQGRLRGNGTLYCTAKATGDTEATLRLDASTPNEPEFFIDLCDENGDRMAGMWLTKDCELYLESDSGPTRIGKATNPIDWVIAYNFTAKDNVSIYSQNANSTTAATINLHSDVMDDPQIEALLENSSGDVLANVSIYADSAQGKSFLSMTSDSYETCIGRPTSKIDHIYALDLQGIIPHPATSNADPPIGSIVMLEVSDSTSVNINVGDQLRSGGGRNLKYAVWDAGAGAWGNRGSALGSSFVFQALSGGSPSSTHANYILAIRVM